MTKAADSSTQDMAALKAEILHWGAELGFQQLQQARNRLQRVSRHVDDAAVGKGLDQALDTATEGRVLAEMDHPMRRPPRSIKSSRRLVSISRRLATAAARMGLNATFLANNCIIQYFLKI